MFRYKAFGRHHFVESLAEFMTAGCQSRTFIGYRHASTYDAFYEDWYKIGNDLSVVLDRNVEVEETAKAQTDTGFA